MSAPDRETPPAPKGAAHAIPQPTGDRIVDLLAERRAVITEQRHETDQTAIEMLGHDIDRIDRELAAERALDAIDPDAMAAINLLRSRYSPAEVADAMAHVAAREIEEQRLSTQAIARDSAEAMRCFVEEEGIPDSYPPNLRRAIARGEWVRAVFIEHSHMCRLTARALGAGS